MTILKCTQTSDCPFLFDCLNDICVHDNIFPVSVYTMFVYLLLPFGIMLTNVGGLSAGIFKVPILMDLLNYTVSKAATLTYPIVSGASLFNLTMLIPKRNPTKDTSLVDFNIVLILLPSVIFSTTLGVIIVRFIPQLYQDLLGIAIFTSFAVFFFNKYRSLSRNIDKSVENRISNVVEMTIAESAKDNN
jgi:uncharacterized membrane protein YfcA